MHSCKIITIITGARCLVMTADDYYVLHVCLMRFLNNLAPLSYETLRNSASWLPGAISYPCRGVF